MANQKAPEVFTEEKPVEPKQGESSLKKGEGNAGQSEVQAKVDVIEDKGYIGVKVDPEPNESYTVAGVTSKTKTS